LFENGRSFSGVARRLSMDDLPADVESLPGVVPETAAERRRKWIELVVAAPPGGVVAGAEVRDSEERFCTRELCVAVIVSIRVLMYYDGLGGL